VDFGAIAAVVVDAFGREHVDPALAGRIVYPPGFDEF
jgi:hypothetical protein